MLAIWVHLVCMRRDAVAVNSNMSFERVFLGLWSKRRRLLCREMRPQAMYEKEARRHLRMIQALQTCIRATKPRPKLVMHALRRAFCCCARDPASHVPTLLHFSAQCRLRMALQSMEQVAGGIVLLFEQSLAPHKKS